MAGAVAINVGANPNLPGVRGPLFPDGSFEYVPIPERKPTAELRRIVDDALAAGDYAACFEG